MLTPLPRRLITFAFKIDIYGKAGKSDRSSTVRAVLNRCFMLQLCVVGCLYSNVMVSDRLMLQAVSFFTLY
ncbi:hypothetical protein ACF3DV_24925 [Chlorogloeopsis fritschii PCC 9212]|uniref:hypothetical protein n=1 Tax=Chlorogloeopsis fritschii TaxID=1124 RepID=UPI0002FA60A8|nr:hypothetical protein [Chlorogloeopsis fritschii]